MKNVFSFLTIMLIVVGCSISTNNTKEGSSSPSLGGGFPNFGDSNNGGSNVGGESTDSGVSETLIVDKDGIVTNPPSNDKTFDTTNSAIRSSFIGGYNADVDKTAVMISSTSGEVSLKNSYLRIEQGNTHDGLTFGITSDTLNTTHEQVAASDFHIHNKQAFSILNLKIQYKGQEVIIPELRFLLENGIMYIMNAQGKYQYFGIKVY